MLALRATEDCWGNLVPFSTQQLVDCDYWSDGCRGGLLEKAFYYIMKNGLAREEDYVYVG